MKEKLSESSLETKDLILQYIRLHPGSHLRQIRRELNKSMGAVQYHLYSLEKERKILSRRSNLYKRFYPALTFTERQQEVLDVLSQETERDLLIYLVHHPAATQKELSEFAQISPGTINWHMRRLVSSTLIRAHRDGQFIRYEVDAETEEIMSLVRGYHQNTLVNWADRFANAMNEVSQDVTGESKENQKKEEQIEEYAN